MPELSHSVPEWGDEGLGYKVSRGMLWQDPGPEDQGWTLASWGNSGEESETGQQDSWLGLRRVTGLAQALKVPAPEFGSRGQAGAR